VLVFPSSDSLSMCEYFAGVKSQKANNETDADVNEGMTAVFIDCTWYQVQKIAADTRLSSKFVFLCLCSLKL